VTVVATWGNQLGTEVPERLFQYGQVKLRCSIQRLRPIVLIPLPLQGEIHKVRRFLGAVDQIKLADEDRIDAWNVTASLQLCVVDDLVDVCLVLVILKKKPFEVLELLARIDLRVSVYEELQANTVMPQTVRVFVNAGKFENGVDQLVDRGG